jgi:diketogulonate reductase-like aldo/keto reductase
MTSRSGLFDFAAVDELKRPAAKYGKSLPQLTLRWTLKNRLLAPHWSASACRPRLSRTWDAGGWEISNADMAEIDVIFDRHGAITLPPGWLED